MPIFSDWSLILITQLRFCFVLIPLFFVSIVFADVERSTLIVNSQKSVEQPFFSHYFATYRVPSVFSMNESYEKGNFTHTTNSFFLSYKWNQHQFFGIVLGIDWLPTRNSSSLHDPAIRIGSNKLIDTSLTVLSSDIRLSFPTTKVSHDQKLITSLSSRHYLVSHFPDKRWFLDSFIFFRWNFFRQSQKGRLFFLFNRTGINRHLTPTFGLSPIALVMQVNKENRQTNLPFQFETPKLGTGVFWKSPKLRFNAYLCADSGHPTLKSLSLLMVTYFRFF